MTTIRVGGLAPDAAERCLAEAFAAIESVHNSMSFHSPESELSLLNRFAHQQPVEVSEPLWTVLQFVQRLTAQTHGAFDVSIAPLLTQKGLLPGIVGRPALPAGTWSQVELRSNRVVFFKQPAWLDLGGVAKGYAVDRAAECIMRWSPPNAVINAGGDLRVLGAHPEPIALRLEHEPSDASIPVLELSEGSLASSSTSHLPGTHIAGDCRIPLPAGLFASVVAESCMVADALTKVVLTRGVNSLAILRSHRAQAYLYAAGQGWRHLQ